MSGTKSLKLGLLFVFLLTFPSRSFADPISIFNTGESGGTALPTGVADPHYSLISAPSGVSLTAITTAPVYWIPNTATTDWISPGANGGSSWPVGTYDYQTTFSLTGDNSTTATLFGSFSTDNDACIYLNSVDTGQCTPYGGNYGSLQSFSIDSGFISGVNTLDFLVVNEGGPTGLFANVQGTVDQGASVTPEPSSLLSHRQRIAQPWRPVAATVDSQRGNPHTIAKTKTT